jgi:RNA polymerase sigma-70 factor (ECF subfamily)
MRSDANPPTSVVDLAALGRLLEESRPRLLALLRRRLGPAVDFIAPDDVIAQAFLKATNGWANRGSFASPYAWLVRVTLDCLTHEWRRVGRRHEIPWPQESSVQMGMHLYRSGTSPSAAAERDEAKRQILAALEALPDLDRTILWLRHFEHLSFRDAADVLGLTENAATVRHNRALKRLKAKWAELFGEGPAA